MKLKDIRDRLFDGGLHPDTLSKKGDVVTFRRGFFYRHGGSADQIADRIRAVFPQAVIVDAGEVWKAFRGGAKTADQSHWFVKFELKEETRG